MRVYSKELNQQLLQRITRNLTEKSTFTNETYLGRLSDDLNIRVELEYGNFAYHPARGVNVCIISKHGCIDKHNFNFGLIWDGNYHSNNYFIYETGWYKKIPTDRQIDKLAEEIKAIASIYKQDS